MNMNDDPFTPGGTKLYEGDEQPEMEIDIDQVSLRLNEGSRGRR